MASIHIWGGGPYHPTRAQAALLSEGLHGAGHQVSYRADRSAFDPERLREADLLVLMGLDWGAITAVDPAHWAEPDTRRPERYEPLSEEHWGAIRAHLGAGKPLLCHHAAILSFDERPELTEIFDGRWIDGQSTHPPYADFTVRRCAGEHPALDGVPLEWRTSDEIYTRLVEPRRSEVLLEAEHDGRAWPLAWAGSYGQSRVLCSLLGHDMRSFAAPELPRFLQNGVGWLLGG